MSALIPKGGWRNTQPSKTSLLGQPQTTTREGPPSRNEPQRLNLLKIAVSLAIAAIADVLNAAFFFQPLVYIPVDIGTVLILFAIWGMRIEILLVLIPELIPGLNMFPTWVVVVGYMCYRSKPK